jgi:ribosome maturation protein Sdo1
MEMFTSVFEPLIVASILIVGGGLFTFFRKMSKTQRELCETVQQLRRTLIILAKAVDRQSNRLHPDESLESDLDDLVKELLRENK